MWDSNSAEVMLSLREHGHFRKYLPLPVTGFPRYSEIHAQNKRSFYSWSPSTEISNKKFTLFMLSNNGNVSYALMLLCVRPVSPHVTHTHNNNNDKQITAQDHFL